MKKQTSILASTAAAILAGAMLLPSGVLNTVLATPNQTSEFSADRGIGSQIGAVTKILVEIDSPYGQETINSFKIIYTDNLMKKEGYTTLRLIGPIMRDKVTLLQWVAADLKKIPLGLSTKMGLVSGGNKPVDMTTAPAGANITMVPTSGKVKVQLLDASQDMYDTNSIRQLEFSGCHVAGYWVGTYWDDRKQIFRDGLQYVEEVNFACTKIRDLTSISEGNRGINVETAINDDGRKIMNEKGELIITSREYREPVVMEQQEEPTQSARQEILTTIQTDKTNYKIGDAATFKVTSTDLDGNAIDPDTIKAYYDGKIVQLEKQDTGLYTYATLGLTKANHQLVVHAEKTDFATDTTYLSIPIHRIS